MIIRNPIRFADDVTLPTSTAKDLETHLNEEQKDGVNMQKEERKYMINFKTPHLNLVWASIVKVGTHLSFDSISQQALKHIIWYSNLCNLWNIFF